MNYYINLVNRYENGGTNLLFLVLYVYVQDKLFSFHDTMLINAARNPLLCSVVVTGRTNPIIYCYEA